MASQRDIQDLINQINQLLPASQQITKSAADFERFYNGAANAVRALRSDLVAARDLIGESAKMVDDLKIDYDTILASIHSQVAALTLRNDFEAKALTAARDRNSLMKRLLSDAQGMSRLSTEDLKLSVATLKNVQGRTAAEQQALNYAKQRLKTQEQEELLLSRIKKTFDGISKIPILGKLFNADDATKAFERTKKALGENFKTADGLKAALKEGFSPANLAMGALGLLASGFEKIKQTIFAMDQGMSDLAKNMNITYQESRAIYKGFVDIGVASGDFSLRASTMAKTLGEINQSLGSSVYLSEQEVKFMTQLREKAGLASEEIAMINKFTKATGQDQKTFTDDFLKSVKAAGERRGIVINEKQALQDVLKISKDIVASFGMSAQKLADAEAAAKKVGISMDKLNSIASTLLDFEQSISAEIEAEILTGKQLNLEMARVYAINNDIAGLAREIEKNYGSIAEFSQMNRLQQEAAAKAVGLTREELAASLLEAQALAGVSGEDAENRKRALDMLIDQYGVAEAQRILDKEGVDKIMEQYSVQQKFNAAVEKLQELFANIAEGPIMAMISGFADLMSYSGVLYTTLVAVGAIMGTLVAAAISIAISMALAKGGVSGVFLGAGALVGTLMAIIPLVMGQVSSAGGEGPQQVGDMSYDPNGGLVVTNPADESMYQLKKSDGMIAGAVSKDGNTREQTPVPAPPQINVTSTVSYDSSIANANAAKFEFDMGKAYNN